MDIPDRRVSGPAFNDSPHLMAAITPDGVLTVVNAAWERALGYRLDELAGRKLARLVDDADRATMRKLINARADGLIELALRCKDGSYRAFEWEGRRVAGEQTIFITGKDVTDRRKLEVTQSLRLYELHAEQVRRRKT